MTFQKSKSSDKLAFFWGGLCVFLPAMCVVPGLHLYFRIWDELRCTRLCLSLDLESLPTSAFHWEMQFFWQVTGTHTWTCMHAQMGASTVAAGVTSPQDGGVARGELCGQYPVLTFLYGTSAGWQLQFAGMMKQQ